MKTGWAVGLGGLIAALLGAVPLVLCTSADSTSDVEAAPKARDYAVELSIDERGTTDESLRFTWPAPRIGASHVAIFRRPDDPDSGAFGEPIATLPGDATSFVDTPPVAGKAFVYRVFRYHDAPPFRADGTLIAGVHVPSPSRDFGVAIIVDGAILPQIEGEIAQLEGDLAAEGYMHERVVTRVDEPPLELRARIALLAQRASKPLKYALLVGHVPVPYAGQINPDGHRGGGTESHRGAWPADVLYGEPTAVLTDESVDTRNDPYPVPERTMNIPGDGRFDQSHTPIDPSIAVGRIDFTRLPALAPRGEIELLKAYFARNHRYRTDPSRFAREAVAHDGFDIDLRGRAGSEQYRSIAAAGYRSLAPLVGPEHVRDEPFLGPASRAPLLFAYAAAPGHFDALQDVARTEDFATRSSSAAFVLLFGSYFGDWDTQDNLLRGALATGETLVALWHGGPPFELGGLRFGETFGEALLRTQRARDEEGQRVGSSVHIALLGDPTLRLPPTR